MKISRTNRCVSLVNQVVDLTLVFVVFNKTSNLFSTRN